MITLLERRRLSTRVPRARPPAPVVLREFSVALPAMQEAAAIHCHAPARPDPLRSDPLP